MWWGGASRPFLHLNRRDAIVPTSVEIAARAGAGAGGISAGAARADAWRSTSRTLAGDREGGELRRQIAAMALRAFGLLRAVDQSFKTMLTILANILENRHWLSPRSSANCARSYLVFKIKEWKRRKPLQRCQPSRRGTCCAEATCKPWPVSSWCAKRTCPHRKSATLKSHPASGFCAIATGNRIAAAH